MYADEDLPTQPPLSRSPEEDNPFWPVLGRLDRWANVMTHKVSGLVGNSWGEFTYHDTPVVTLHYGVNDPNLHVRLTSWDTREAGKCYVYMSPIDPSESVSRQRVLAALHYTLGHNLERLRDGLQGLYLNADEPGYLFKFVRKTFLGLVCGTRIRNLVTRCAFSSTPHQFTFSFYDQALDAQSFDIPMSEIVMAKVTPVILRRYLMERYRKFIEAFHDHPATRQFSIYILKGTDQELQQAIALITDELPPKPQYPDDQQEYTIYGILRRNEQWRKFWREARRGMDEIDERYGIDRPR